MKFGEGKDFFCGAGEHGKEKGEQYFEWETYPFFSRRDGNGGGKYVEK